MSAFAELLLSDFYGEYIESLRLRRKCVILFSRFKQSPFRAVPGSTSALSSIDTKGQGFMKLHPSHCRPQPAAGLLALAAATLIAGAANAQTLVDRYTFNDTGTTVLDSVGGQNGTLVGGATESGGSLVTNGTGNAGGNGLTTQGANLGAAYKLPGGAVTFEDFFTPTGTQPAFATLFSFSNSTTNYTIGTVQRGTDGKPGVQDSQGGKVGSTLQPGSFLAGSLNDLVVEYNGKTATAYLTNANGSFSASAPDTFLPGALSPTSFNGIADASPFPDGGLNGTTQEFRIYSGVLTPAEVAGDFQSFDMCPPGPCVVTPESSTNISFGLLLALGSLTLGGVAIILRKPSAKA